jgi:hypothetical protein
MTLSRDLPPVQAHPALNKVVQPLDRRRHGRALKNRHVLDTPAMYLYMCVHKDGATEWVPGRPLFKPKDRRLSRAWTRQLLREWRFRRELLDFQGNC